MSNSYEMINRAHNVLNEAPAEKCELEKQYFNGIDLTAIKDSGIKNHLSAYVSALHDIDIAGLKTAYHVAAIKPLLESNTSGLQTDFVKFCRNTLNVGKAQAYNMLLAGNMVVMLYDENGKNPIYTDVFTYELCEHDYKAIKKRKCFGQTQLVYLGRLTKKYELTIDSICELIEKGAIIPSMSVKAISKYIEGTFIQTKADESKPIDEKPTDEKPTDEKPTDEKPTDEKPTDEKPTDENTIIYSSADIETVKALLSEVVEKLTDDGYKLTLDKLNKAIEILEK